MRTTDVVRGVLMSDSIDKARLSYKICRGSGGRLALQFKYGWDAHLARPEYAFSSQAMHWRWHESRKNNGSVLEELVYAPTGAQIKQALHWNGFYYYDQFKMEWRELLDWREQDKQWLEQRVVLEKLAEGT